MTTTIDHSTKIATARAASRAALYAADDGDLEETSAVDASGRSS